MARTSPPVTVLGLGRVPEIVPTTSAPSSVILAAIEAHPIVLLLTSHPLGPPPASVPWTTLPAGGHWPVVITWPEGGGSCVYSSGGKPQSQSLFQMTEQISEFPVNVENTKGVSLLSTFQPRSLKYWIPAASSPDTIFHGCGDFLSRCRHPFEFLNKTWKCSLITCCLGS